MIKSFHPLGFLLCLLAFGFFYNSGCTNPTDSKQDQNRKSNLKGEYIYRSHDEYLPIGLSPEKITPTPYPWEDGTSGQHSKITKEFFRCKGSNLNPVRAIQEKNGETSRYYDCGGSSKHSLPLRNGKEFIHPVLIDILNYVQKKTLKRVVITSGHRCPEHNTYADPSITNRYSKHMIGAAVAFYVQGLEEHPEAIVKLIQEYYKVNPSYKDQKEYLEFMRYEKNDTDVTTLPWFNKEIFIKFFKKKEGRDFDNRHPYPYISIQVRFDRDVQEKVNYSWEKANQNYLRY